MKVVDMHCDTIAALYENKEKGWTLQDNRLHIRLDKMKQGDYLLQNFALFVCTENCEDPYQQALTLADCFDRQMALFPEQIGQVRCYNDILENQKNGRMSALLTIEEGAVCQGSLEKLREFYDRGVRMLTLTWNFPNEIGFPNFAISEDGKPDRTVPNTKDGLTEFGFLFLEEMERLGIDGDTAQVGPQISEHLDIPVISYAQNLKVEGDSVIVERQYDDRYHVLKAKMPCLVTALAELNEPRYMTPGGIFDAYDAEITVWGRKDLKDVDDSNLGLKGSPTQIAKASDKVRKGAGEKVALDPAESVDYIMDKLLTKHVI